MSNVNLNRLRNRVNELIEEQGADSVPFDVLVRHLNGELEYWEALNILGKEKHQYSEIQKILIEELHPSLEQIHDDNRKYLKDIFRELHEEQEAKNVD